MARVEIGDQMRRHLSATNRPSEAPQAAKPIPDDIQGIAAQVAQQTGAIYDVAPIANALLAERQRCAKVARGSATHYRLGAEHLRENSADGRTDGTDTTFDACAAVASGIADEIEFPGREAKRIGRAARVGYEIQGTAYDKGAAAHELVGRDSKP